MDNSSSSGTVDIESGDYSIHKRLTLTWRNVSVNVTAPDAALGDTLLSVADPRQALGWFKKNQRPKRVSLYGDSD